MGRPSSLHATLASTSVNRSVQKYPQEFLKKTWSKPDVVVELVCVAINLINGAVNSWFDVYYLSAVNTLSFFHTW